jgi:hypothetical protein
MLKISRFAMPLAAALCWIAVSCSTTLPLKSPAASAMPTGGATAPSAQTADKSAVAATGTPAIGMAMPGQGGSSAAVAAVPATQPAQSVATVSPQTGAGPSVAIAASPFNSADLFLITAGIGFFAFLGGSIFVCRTKPS